MEDKRLRFRGEGIEISPDFFFVSQWLREPWSVALYVTSILMGRSQVPSECFCVLDKSDDHGLTDYCPLAAGDIHACGTDGIYFGWLWKCQRLWSPNGSHAGQSATHTLCFTGSSKVGLRLVGNPWICFAEIEWIIHLWGRVRLTAPGFRMSVKLSTCPMPE